MLYQSHKARLKNYIINLSTSPSHKCPRDVQWVEDGMAQISSVSPSATYKEWFKTLVKFITLPSKARDTTLKIVIDTYVEFSVKEGERRQSGSFHECFPKFCNGRITDTVMNL